MAFRSNQTACQDCVLAKTVPDTPTYAVTRDQLKAIGEIRVMARYAWTTAGSNQHLRDFALDVYNRLKGL